MNKEDKVVVLVGGPSSEAEISRVTGAAIAAALREKGYNVEEMELQPTTVLADLQAVKAKVVFNLFCYSSQRTAIFFV